jgi:RNA polymerase sigma-54 factor
MLKGDSMDARARQFIQNNIRSARWLIESIQQRRGTLLRVVEAVLRHQREFLQQGPQHLQPLPMTKVAEELGIHVGTVSRAVAGKYVQTPLGIWPLRHFFCGGTETKTGESISWDGIKVKLQEIIDNEDKSEPLSDDQIVEKLQAHGLELARRTVAKYRKLLDIPPARQRRQY